METAQLFLKAWQLRVAFFLIFTAVFSITITSVTTDSLELSPQQSADAVLGTADGRVQIPGSAPVGADGRSLDARLLSAVTNAGGQNASLEYLASSLHIDEGDESTFAIEELENQAAADKRLVLLSGKWPTAIGETAISSSLNGTVDSTVSFFNGGLSLSVVGTFRDIYNTQARTLVVPSGTWSSLRSLPQSAVANLDQSAGRILRWEGNTADSAILAAVRTELDSSGIADDSDLATLEVEARPAIESISRPPNVPLLSVSIGGPLIVGLLGGLLGGGFIARIRTVMWTVGVPYKQTRVASNLALISTSMVGGIAGVGLGLLAIWPVRILLEAIATQALGPVAIAPSYFLPIVLSSLGTLCAIGIQNRRLATSEKSHAGDKFLFLFAGAAVLASIGIFIGTGTSDVAKMLIAGLAISVSILMIAVPPAVHFLRLVDPSSFASKLALRQFSSPGQRGSLVVITLAGILVLGYTVTILATSSVVSINSSTESQVPPGQIVLETPLPFDEAEIVRHDVEDLLGISGPVFQMTASVGSELSNGPTRVVDTVADLARILGISLDTEQATFLENGGMLMTSAAPSDNVSFPSSGDFQGASFPVQTIEQLDPSFRNVSGFLLTPVAENANLPLAGPTYVYTGVSADEIMSAKSAAVELGLNPGWLKIFDEPDEFVIPLRISAITVLLSLIAGTILLITATGQARAMRPELAGLRSIGVNSRFIARVVVVRLMLTFALAMLSSLAASAIGVATAFKLAGLSFGVAIPIIPILAMFVSLAGFVAIAAALATRRLRNGEWQE